MTKTRNKKQEILAKFFHENTWSHWMKYLFLHSKDTEDYTIIHPKNVERWKRQMNTDYDNLSEREKDNNRSIATIFRQYLKDNGYMLIAKKEYDLMEFKRDE